MQEFTSEMVDKYASDLLFRLSPDENKLVLEEFTVIDEQIKKVEQIEGIDKIEPLYYALDREILDLRDDEVKSEMPIEDILKNASETEGREIEIPKVVSSDE